MKNQKLISFRKNQNLSVSCMAKSIGISQSYYEKIEYGSRCPSYNFLIKFKKVFPEADMNDIFLSKNHT